MASCLKELLVVAVSAPASETIRAQSTSDNDDRRSSSLDSAAATFAIGNPILSDRISHSVLI